MLCGFFLLFFLCADTVTPQVTDGLSWLNTFSFMTSNYPRTTEEMLSTLQLVAIPDYPVSAGQTVHLHCSVLSEPASVNWTWQHLENQIWQEVGSGRDLTLSKPWQSGLYHCRARTETQPWRESLNHTVYIISRNLTVGENLGIAAFALTLLTLIINLAVLSWMGWKRFGDKLSTSITAAKVSPAPGKSPKGDLQQTESEGDVYMNYTSTNQAYSDLDPVTMTDDSVYSSLS
ncbi:uncharacterized protein LOC132993185 [Labrus mixtus]|uniref:uncharacterized protein LOC132993185 n=1 Tax=Labrus mixtus TaxID=508554 RepID=UPI0029C0A5DF|nr:uncharacterized protein LOC132993185 [Labrus mixtus]